MGVKSCYMYIKRVFKKGIDYKLNNILILCDTRQQKDEHITKYFNEHNILWQRATLTTGDYMAIKIINKPDDEQLFEYPTLIKDFSTIIDTKKDIVEICGNLCRSVEHERIKREIAKAHDLGCERFIFLIADTKVSCIDDLVNWASKRTNVKGVTLAKIMKTMSERYGCEFIFTKKSEMGAKIIELLRS